MARQQTARNFSLFAAIRTDGNVISWGQFGYPGCIKSRSRMLCFNVLDLDLKEEVHMAKNCGETRSTSCLVWCYENQAIRNSRS